MVPAASGSSSQKKGPIVLSTRERRSMESETVDATVSAAMTVMPKARVVLRSESVASQ